MVINVQLYRVREAKKVIKVSKVRRRSKITKVNRKEMIRFEARYEVRIKISFESRSLKERS